MSNVLFGKFGWALLATTLALLIITALALPYIMSPLHLVFPEKWVLATRSVVQVAFGTWVATAFISIIRIVVWLRAVYAVTTPLQYDAEKEMLRMLEIFPFGCWEF